MARLSTIFLLVLIFAALCTVSDAKQNKAKFKLRVGKQKKMPELTNKKGKKERKEEPTTDIVPQSAESTEPVDFQQHYQNKGENLETGTPPKYPSKALSAEATAHSNEIGGCRDHPHFNNSLCTNCGNRCFSAEHELYTYQYCRRSCNHCDANNAAFHTYWRLRAGNDFDPDWMLKEVEFYPNSANNITLADDPKRAYASSSYTGFKESFAFDNDSNTAWYPSGWGKHDNNDDWIAYEFSVAVRIHAVRMKLDSSHRTASPTKIFVEAADKKFGPWKSKWTIRNPTYEVDKIFTFRDCPVLWKRMENDNGTWCFRLMAKFLTWTQAKDSCTEEGGKLSSILSKDEQNFISDEVGLCGDTWVGLAHKNQAYFWDDGSNSTYRNWSPSAGYSDRQRENLNCIAVDQNGYWKLQHCSNKNYFVCRQKLEQVKDPKPELIVNGWPYEPEIPPVIFMAPNMTVPVVNTEFLEPGVFPDENGNVEEDDEEEDMKTQQRELLYKQTVQHLKEKGLKPSDDITKDEEVEKTDYTQQLNKIAVDAGSVELNETETSANNDASKDAKAMDNKVASQNTPNSQNTSTPTVNQNGNEVKPPPSDGNSSSSNTQANTASASNSQGNKQTDGSQGKQQSKLPQSPIQTGNLNDTGENGNVSSPGSGNPNQAPNNTKNGGNQQQGGNPQQGSSAQVNNSNTDNNNNNKNKNKNKQAGGNVSGTAPSPQTEPSTSNDDTDKDSRGRNNNSGPPKLNPATPSKLPKPPPAKEGNGTDDDSQLSIGGQGNETSAKRPPTKPKGKGKGNDSVDDKDDENGDDSSDDSDDNSDDDAEEDNKKDDSVNIPEQPIPVKDSPPGKPGKKKEKAGKTKDKQKSGDKSTNSLFIKKKSTHKKGKISTIKHGKVKKSKTKKNQIKITNFAIPKRTKIEASEEETDESGSGSGDQGEDEDIDGIMQEITTDLW